MSIEGGPCGQRHPEHVNSCDFTCSFLQNYVIIIKIQRRQPYVDRCFAGKNPENKTYGEYIAKNICQIYFLRKKNDVNKSFVTIEVKDNKVVQARIKYNELPPEEVNKVIRKWEKGFKVIYKNSN